MKTLKALFNIVYLTSKDIMLAAFVAIAVEGKVNALTGIIAFIAFVLTFIMERIKLNNKDNQKGD